MRAPASPQRKRWHLLVAALGLAIVPGTGSASAPDRAVREVECSLDRLVEEARTGLRSTSPAYRRYLSRVLLEAAISWPEQELAGRFAAESDPEVVELLGAALARLSDHLADDDAGDRSGLHAVAWRAESDPDPAIRAAAVAALRGSSALEETGDLYTDLLRDPSPEVRAEAAQNLLEDNHWIYSGQDGPAADAAVRAAAASTDPDATATVLRELSTGAISGDSAAELRRLLAAENTQLRAASARALGGVPASELPEARDALLARFGEETDLLVRKAIVESLARLEFAGAVPTLLRLRRIDPRLAGEIDLWIRVLGMGLHEWSVILREKQRLSS